MKRSELRQIIKEELLEISHQEIQKKYDAADIATRKEMLGPKYKKYATRVYNALPSSATDVLLYGKARKDPWKIDKPKYQSYGDRKDN